MNTKENKMNNNTIRDKKNKQFIQGESLIFTCKRKLNT